MFNRRRTGARLTIAIILPIAGLTLLFFYQLAFTDHILARGDTYSYFYPYWSARSAAFLDGRLPLWTPDLFMGVPLLANPQVGTFYPPNWLVTWLTPPDAIRVSILLHVAWAALGAYLLAQRTLGVSPLAGLLAAALFAFGGYLGGHVEQINQLQGLSWLPWLMLILDWSLDRPFPRILVLALAFALQFFSGHTQTVFMSALALAIYALLTRPLRGLLVLAAGGLIALVLAAPQLIPTLELVGLSNRSGGFSLNQATAFSFSPLLIGRGLLPSYDGMIFSEYIAYPGVIGLGLALIAAITARFRSRWVVLALIGVILSFGAYNPIYWGLAGLPGFNLFRVPARWLALFALGAAMLAARGFQGLLDGQRPSRRVVIAVIAVIAALALTTPLARFVDGGESAAPPELPSLIGWGVAGIALVAVLHISPSTPPPLLPRKRGEGERTVPSPRLRGRGDLGVRGLVVLALLELFAAARVLPYNHLVPPETYSDPRFTIRQMRVYGDGQTPPDRMLSISGLLFDPGDRAALETRYAGLSETALHNAFITVKQREIVAPNMPLSWGIPTVDGFDGGLLPTTDYTAFTSLMLPDGEPRTVDGRLRELLALEGCRGACIPDRRWLDLTDTRYLITDKVYDLVHEGIFYDTQFEVALVPDEDGGNGLVVPGYGFELDAVDVLYACEESECPPPALELVDADGQVVAHDGALDLGTLDGYNLARLTLSEPLTPDAVRITSQAPITVRAVTLVDTRTGDFQQTAPPPWTRVLSSDIKIYENESVLPRAFVVYDARYVPDDEAGTETALALMRDPAFDPAAQAIIAGAGDDFRGGGSANTVTFRRVAAERVEIAVETNADGYLVLTDAYYPGWTATVDGTPVEIERADVMFRAVRVPAGASEFIFTYQPAGYPPALWIGVGAFAVCLMVLTGYWITGTLFKSPSTMRM